MALDFTKLKTAIAQQFNLLAKNDLFRADVSKDELWATYLDSFPPGTNPIYRERTEHDCSCCRQFIGAVGNAVAVIDGEIVSIWDVEVDDPAYQAVCDALARLVKSKPIDNTLLHIEKTAGADKSFEDMLGSVKTWGHFFVNIPNGRNGEKNFVCKGVDQGPKLSQARALHDVLYRSLTELSDDAIETVLDLIAQNSLYRGEEHKFAVSAFQKLKKQFNKLPTVAAGSNFDMARDAFVWSKISETPASVSKIRNTSIGTLLIDLSEGVELDQAVRKFESVVAPANYKRPTALVTPKMVANAKTTIAELGLTSALERRYAKLSDISVNDILFADRNTRSVLEGDVFDSIATKTPAKSKALDKVEEVSIDKFLSEIVPRAESIEVMVENRHQSNLVSLIAPVDPTSGSLFKWANNFSWSYNGDMADSIKERVKKAGGNVSGDLCCRLAWHNTDDLDFHMQEPGGYEINFTNRRTKSSNGGTLDLDANGADGMRTDPAENIYYGSRRTMREGTYHLFVHQYSKRNSTDTGFEAEIDFMGNVYSFAYEKPLKTGDRVTVAKFRYSEKGGVEMLESLPSSQASKSIWNVKTQDFQKVNVLMTSPNFWGDRGVGNKHYFFMLEGCQNDGQARGFFNEFLKEELTPHRKVIEIVGSKMRTEESVDQLSGLGFSSTQRSELLVRVKGSFTRTIKVMF